MNTSLTNLDVIVGESSQIKYMKQEEEKKQEKILKWRLGERPTVSGLTLLVDSGIIKKEEARQILLDETKFNSKDFEDVLKEIELLRKLVLEVSNTRPNQIIHIIEKEIPRWYPNVQPLWTNPYVIYCNSTASLGSNCATTSYLNGTTTAL